MLSARGPALSALRRAAASSSSLCASLALLHPQPLPSPQQPQLHPLLWQQQQQQGLPHSQSLSRALSGVAPAGAAAEDAEAVLVKTTVGDILESKGAGLDGSWLWCTTEDTVYEAVKSMTANNVGALLVLRPGSSSNLDEGIAGIVTERDYLRKIIVQGRSSKTTKVGEIMTEENKLITVKPNTKVLHAMEIMTENRIRHIPVIEHQKLRGMVSVGDVVKAVLQEHKDEVHRLSDYIKGTY